MKLQKIQNVHIGAVPDSDELSEASAVSSSDETVKVSNTSAPATAVSEGGPTSAPATAASEGGSTHNVPAVSQDTDDTPVVGAESEEGDYAVFSDEGDDLTMPPMVDLASQGLRRSPRLVTQELKNYACSMLKKICAFGMVLAVVLSQPLNVSSHAHACVKSSVFQCATVNAKFDQTLNSIHHMILAARQTNNEVYTFKDMLKEDDRA